ncbi:dTMP kinase [Lentibacillus cibarius]|uniref:Thymidylate kinase n=1 Tax=Lentibacillus cibarius TaxID=2583219 RepID=A0A549YGT7_9BACI|nr:dTMP kinase [Lentibacillus cibarius]TRM11092.1 dTMP kinase [Lentibacillus cibarius]
MNGYFITFEGGEGAGKSSILQAVARKLSEGGYDVLATREPGGIDIAEKIRQVILDKTHTAMDARTEALLYAAARRQHLAEKIIPALNEGKLVLCDRFIDSSLVYQGYARGIGMDEVFAINQFAIRDVFPDMTLFFDIPPTKGLARITANENRERNRLDMENIRFHEMVYEAYQMLLSQFPKRIQTIDADQPFEQVKANVMKVLQSGLQKHVEEEKQ